MLKISSNSNNKTGSNEKLIIHLDKYSKTVLSVIALCLVLIAGNIYFSPREVNAYETVQDVNIKSINGSSFSGSYLPIDIQRIDGSTSRDLRVDIRSVNGRSVYGDKIPVDIQGINGQFIVGGDLPVKVR